MRRVRSLAVVLALAAPALAAAIDAPHEKGIFCSKCHMGHNAPGGALTNVAGNANLCDSCHDLHTGKYGFPWAAGDQAVPGAGRSHRWDALATNLGATAPLPGTPMGDRLDAGKLQCSTCHDQHDADALMGGDAANLGTQHAPITFSSTAVPAGTGTMAFAAGFPAAGATAKFYLVQIVVAGDQTSARFRLSNDKGATWWGCSGPGAYEQYVESPSNACLVGPSVALNDDTNVRVAFAGGAGAFKIGDQWDLYVSYPFLRVANKSSAMCVACHKNRNMTWQNVEGTGPIVGTGAPVVLGTTVFSHPVGQKLNDTGRSNGLPAILDANGATQATGDGIATNDLRVAADGLVGCMTCHHPHNTDSNSLSEDPR